MEFTVSKKQSYDKDCVYTYGELHNTNPNTGLSAENHMSHCNFIIDTSYKFCGNESVIRNSFSQESNILFSKITNIAELYPGTHNTYNSGKSYKKNTDNIIRKR